jgi:hypothetical protein
MAEECREVIGFMTHAHIVACEYAPSGATAASVMKSGRGRASQLIKSDYQQNEFACECRIKAGATEPGNKGKGVKLGIRSTGLLYLER